ncbi:chromosome partitioning protein [Micromonospora echinofusca]|uniref:chromosome partitioning protein n=1 Tax=Micromonospora echinofusca TaxID=47858 RepID=UPI00344A4AFC
MPAPRAPQTGPGRVDLDMPFSLDQPVAPVPVTSPRPLTAARTSPGAGEPTQGFARRREDVSPVIVADAFPGGRPSPHDAVRGPDAPAEADRPSPAADATRPGPGEPAGTDRLRATADATTPDGPSTGGHETGSRANGIAATNDSPQNGSADGPANGSAGGSGSTADGSPANGSAGGGVTSGGPVPGGGARMPAESPWAQPPQRPAAAATAPGPGPGAADPTPASQAAEPGQVAQQYPSQRGPADQGPHPWGPGEPGAPRQQAPPQTDALHGPSPQDQAGQDPHAGQDPPVGPATDLGTDPAAPQQAAPPGPYPPSQAGPYPPQQGASPPGPYPPGWYPPPWPQAAPVGPAPQQAYQPAEGVTAVPPAQPDATWHPAITDPPTAEDFARRRQVRPADPVATMGVRAVVNRMGLRLPPGRHEQEVRRDIETVRRNFGGLRQVTVVNPKGGAGKTVAILLLAMTFGQKRGGYVLAWDNNETQGTLGMRAQQDFHSRTVRDMLRDLGQFQGAHGRVGDLSQYVRSQGEGMFDVLASDESATGGEMLTAAAFAEIREVVSRFYKLIFVDTGNNVRAQNWQAAMDATDQLVVTMSARNDSAETAARMLDHLEQSGRQRLVRQAVTVVSMPPSRKEIDLPAIQEHFAARTRAVLLAPYERLIDTGEPIRYGGLSAASRDAWLKIAAAVAEGL